MKLTNYLLLGIIALPFFSCKKDKKNCNLTEANFAGSYKISSVKYKMSSSSSETDGTSFIDACALDDITTFGSNHTYTYTDAGVKCDPDGGGTSTWSLSGNTVTVDSDAETIQNFDCSGFSISVSDVDISGDQLTVTFKKQ